MGRRHERFLTTDLPGTVSPSIRVEVLNLSVEGLAIQTAIALKPGKIYTIQVGRGSETMALSGTVKWSTLRGTRTKASGDAEPVWESGIALGEQYTATPFHLLPLIENHAVFAPGETIVGSLEIDGVESRVPLEVLRLAADRIVVEAPLPVEQLAMGEVRLRIKEQEILNRIQVARVHDSSDSSGVLKFELELHLVDPPSTIRDLIREELAQKIWPRQASGATDS